MGLNSLLVSSDEKTVRVLRRVLCDLEIGVELCCGADAAIRKLTRQRFEAIIVDCCNREEASSVLRSVQAAPVNKRALSIALVEAAIGLRGGFEMGAHFVLYKPLSNERTKASFRAVRALMNRERRLQLRVPVEVPVTCNGSDRYKASTIDVCEGGMAIRFNGKISKEGALRFSLELPGLGRKLELYGELAWEDIENQAGVRFTNLREEQRAILRQWLSSRIPEADQDDPPIHCSLTDLSPGGCYLKTSSPFPKGTRVVLFMKANEIEISAGGIVRIAHPEFGMGVEFMRATSDESAHAHRMIEALRSAQDAAPGLRVAPDGLESSPVGMEAAQGSSDALVDLFLHKSQVPVEVFLQQMEQQRQVVQSH
jgi:PilZ domain